jgi:hypothetical protein
MSTTTKQRVKSQRCISLRSYTLRGYTLHAAMIVAALAGSTWSQDPFDAAAPKAGGQPEAKGEVDPFGGAAPAPAVDASERPAAKGKQKAPPPEPLPRELQLLRDLRLQTPLDLLRGAQTALAFGRPDETKRYLAQFVEGKPADEVIAPLTARFGDFLSQIRRLPEVQPEGAQAADLIFGAAERTAQSAERIDALIAKLSDPQVGVRRATLGDLSLAGTRIVNPMLRVLADRSRENEHANIRAALVRLGAISERPLVAALATTNEALKLQIVAVLGRMRSREAVARLVRPAVDPQSSPELRELAGAAVQQIVGAKPDLYEAEKHLRREAERLLAGELPYRPDADDRLELWSWDEAQQMATITKLPKVDAAALLAARAARDLFALKPGDLTAQRLMLLANLQFAKAQAGMGLALPTEPGTIGAEALAAGPQILNQVLADALRDGKVAAAIAAAELLGQAGDAGVLRANAGGASPLAEAMRHPDRRVRLAATLAAVKLAPGESFAGASHVSEALGWFVGTSGTSSVLIGHPRGEEAQTLVALVNESGYDGEAAYLGRVLVERAFANPDFEMILIADAIDIPPVVELVQWLRRDYRTARQPIGVMARSENLDALREALKEDAFTLVFPRLYSGEVTALTIARLKEIAGRNLVERDERTAQAEAALAALSVLAKDQANFAGYELLRLEPTLILTLQNPVLSAGAAQVLSLLGTPRAQKALVDFASQHSRALENRQAAAAGFAAAVKARGLLLTQVQIAEQYARYNATARLDVETQAVMGSLLDAIEAPAMARGELTRAND